MRRVRPSTRHTPGKGDLSRSRRDRLEFPSNGLSHFYKHNHKRAFAWRDDDVLTSPQSSLSRFADIYRHHATVFFRYQAEGRCTAKQLLVIEALFIDGLTLQEVARQEGVAPEAIRHRIKAVANKAPEFYRWWSRLNEGRRRGGRRRAGDLRGGWSR